MLVRLDFGPAPANTINSNIFMKEKKTPFFEQQLKDIPICV